MEKGGPPWGFRITGGSDTVQDLKVERGGEGWWEGSHHHLIIVVLEMVQHIVNYLRDKGVMIFDCPLSVSFAISIPHRRHILDMSTASSFYRSI